MSSCYVTSQSSPNLSRRFGDSIVEIDDGKDLLPDTWYQSIRAKLEQYVQSFGFRIFGLLLIIMDIVLVIVDFSLSHKTKKFEHEIQVVSFSIALFFVVDVLLRIFVENFKVYFGLKLNIVDACVVLLTLVVSTINTFSTMSEENLFPSLVKFLRVLRVLILVRVFRLAAQKKELEKVTRRMVSENKRRYRKDGFDLDLTYITNKIIAMSFPSSGKQSFFRNPIEEVARFLDTKHEGHYKVYNLCSEEGYDPKFFHYNVERFYIDDHNVPSLEDMLKFTTSVRNWMSQHPDNVIAPHCKGGKGRTGTMICIWLLDTEQFMKAEESLAFFGERRTDMSVSSKFQGVETPSQSRYVHYYEIMKNKYDTQMPPLKKLQIKSVRINSIAGVGNGDGSDLVLRIVMKKKTVFHCSCATHKCAIFLDVGHNATVISVLDGPVVEGDVKVLFESTSHIPKGYEDVPFYFWFNTSFVEENKLCLTREELDNPHKQKTWHVFKEDFAVTMFFKQSEETMDSSFDCDFDECTWSVILQ